jgi:hypothetical protein
VRLESSARHTTDVVCSQSPPSPLCWSISRIDGRSRDCRSRLSVGSALACVRDPRHPLGGLLFYRREMKFLDPFASSCQHPLDHHPSVRRLLPGFPTPISKRPPCVDEASICRSSANRLPLAINRGRHSLARSHPLVIALASGDRWNLVAPHGARTATDSRRLSGIGVLLGRARSPDRTVALGRHPHRTGSGGGLGPDGFVLRDRLRGRADSARPARAPSSSTSSQAIARRRSF